MKLRYARKVEIDIGDVLDGHFYDRIQKIKEANVINIAFAFQTIIEAVPMEAEDREVIEKLAKKNLEGWR